MKPQEKIEEPVGSNLPAKLTEVQLQADPTATAELNAIPNAFTTFFTGRFHGPIVATGFHAGIAANSRVVVSISEFGANPQQRFVGGARMAVYNVAPFAGGFRVWFEVFWSSDLNIRLDVFVDP